MQNCSISGNIPADTKLKTRISYGGNAGNMHNPSQTLPEEITERYMRKLETLIIKNMIKNEKEMNADIIWQHLKKNGGCSTKELKKQLKMNDKEFLIALNWLSRENKIVFYAKEKIEHV
jgi:hypothetical protein